MSSPQAQLARVMSRIYAEGLTTPSGGNLSLRGAEGDLWVTPSQVDKGRLEPHHMVRVLPDGSWEGACKPTSEWPFHRAVLAVRSDLQALVHAHPTALVAFSVVGKRLPQAGFPDLVRWAGALGNSDFALPGSQRLGDHLAQAFAEGCDAVLMENHGVVVGGRDLAEAYHRFHALEHLATIHLGGLRLGPTQAVPPGSPVSPAWETGSPERPREAGPLGEELADLTQRAYGRRLLGSRCGAFSVRCGPGYLVTAEGVDRANPLAGDLVYVEGGRIAPGPSPDAMAPLHGAIFAAHPGVQSVATALPPSLMAFAASGVPFDARTIPEAYLFLKTVPTLPLGVRTQPDVLAAALGPQTPVALVAHACAVVTGASPFQVFDRLEVAEFTARTILDSLPLGPLRPLGQEVLQEICRVYGV